MTLPLGQELLLCDSQQRSIGRVTFNQIEGDLLLGEFNPGPAFSNVEQLFRDFEEAVNLQALSVVDSLDAGIAALGLQLSCPDGPRCIAVRDVQIWSDGGMSCKLGQATAPAVNGVAAAAGSKQPMPK